MLAIDILKWPGMNMAFIFSFVVTMLLTLAAVPYAKRRPKGTPLAWGEAMLASVYVFFVLFMAYGVVPHQWLTHVQNELGWRADKPFLGWGDFLKAKSRGGNFPFEINFLQVGDVLVVGIYGFFLGLQMRMWKFWQTRGDAKPSTDLATSTYGRPLVKKA